MVYRFFVTLVLLGTSLIAQDVADVQTEAINTISVGIDKVFWVGLWLCITYFGLKIPTYTLNKLAEVRPSMRIGIKRFVPIINILGWMLSVLLLVKVIFNPPYQTLVAFGASAGLAIGFASQEILKNIFGGIILLIEKPFLVGDKIQVGDYYGEVIQIGLRSVRIVTPDDSMVSISNSELVQSAVSNSNTGASYCQVVANFYLPLDTDVAATKQIMMHTARVSNYIKIDLPVVVIVTQIIDHGVPMLRFKLKAYVMDIRYEFKFISDLTERVTSELQSQHYIQSSQHDSIKKAC